jgi:hypothetical protein
MYEAIFNRRRPLGNRVTNPDRKAAMNLPPEIEEHGQGLYTLIVLLVALVFWVAIKNTDIGTTFSNGWSSITSCVSNPTTCNASS